MQDSQWYSLDEIAAHLKVKRATIYKWIERNNLPAHKAGKLWRFDVEEVNDWVKSDPKKQAGPEDDRKMDSL